MRDKELTLIEHLEELRSRLIKSIIFIIVASCLPYYFADEILASLAKPVGDLVFIEAQEAFVPG